MTRALAFICGLLVLTTATLAQSGGSPADPISGTWTGSVGPGATPQYGIRMELKFDGTGAVSGSAHGANPGDSAVVRTGAFDPKTGALKLELELKNGGATATFEGTVVLGTATGRLSVSDQPGPGTFLLTKRSASSDSPAGPPPGAPGAPDATDAAAALAKGFAEVSGWIAKAAELVPADKYGYQPAKTVRSFGQLIAHIADSHNYDCARAAGRNVQWSDAVEKGRTDKATLLPKLKQSIDACTAVYGSGQVVPLISNLGHSNLHYGNVITYMRMLGLVPPSS